MIYFNLNAMNITTILLSLIIIFVLINYISHRWHGYFYPLHSIEEYKKAKTLFLKHLDIYYVTNTFFTYTAAFIYFIGNISIVIVLRYLFKNSKTKSSFPIEIDFDKVELMLFVPIIYNLVLIVIAIITYKKMLDQLFFKEVLKLYFSLCEKLWFCNYESFRIDWNFREIMGKSYLFLYNISKLRVNSEETPLEEQQEFHQHNIIYDNHRVLALSTLAVDLSRKFVVFFVMVKIFTKIIQVIYDHIAVVHMGKRLLYTFYFTSIFYDFLHLTIYYSYYLFFPFYTITLLLSCTHFFEQKDAVCSSIIYNYFYNNSVSYKIQRISFNHDSLFIQSPQNRELFDDVRYIQTVEYVLSNFNTRLYWYKDYEPFLVLFNKRLRGVSKRYHHLFLIDIILIFYSLRHERYILTSQIFSLPLFWIIVVLYITAICITNKIFKSHEGNINDDERLYIYNRKYHILFWVILTLISFLVLITLVKGTLLIIPDSILWQGFQLKIVIVYTLEEQVAFFYDYLDKLLINNHASTYTTTTIRLFIDQLDIKNFITKETTFNELKLFAQEIVVHYANHVKALNEYYDQLNELQGKYLARTVLIRSVMDCTSNIINLICFSKFLEKGITLWHIVANPRSIRTIKFVQKIAYLIIIYMGRR